MRLGRCIEDRPILGKRWVTLGTRIPRGLWRRLQGHCVAHDRRVQHVVQEALAEALVRRRRETR
jgi:hypothetical protein